MLQNIDQMPLEARIPALKEMALLCRSRKEQCAKEEAEFLDELAKAESTLGGRTDIPKSGLIEHNPYATETPPASDAEGDAVDPATGKSAGGDPPPGSESSHPSHHKHAKKS